MPMAMGGLSVKVIVDGVQKPFPVEPTLTFGDLCTRAGGNSDMHLFVTTGCWYPLSSPSSDQSSLSSCLFISSPTCSCFIVCLCS